MSDSSADHDQVERHRIIDLTDYIKRAQQQIAAGEATNLRYACLELRLAIEKLAYKKLQSRLDRVGIKGITRWQPQRVIETLKGVVDEYIDVDSTFSVTLPGSDERQLVGKTAGVNAKLLGDHWHKLGSYLHLKLPTQKEEKIENTNTTSLISFLGEVIAFLDKSTDANFDLSFGELCKFECEKCSQPIARNVRLLGTGDVIECQNPNCNAGYTLEKIETGCRIRRSTMEFICPKCEKRNCAPADVLLNLKRSECIPVTCFNCKEKYEAYWAPVLR